MANIDVSTPFTRAAARIGGIAANLGKARDRAVGTLARRLPVIARRDLTRRCGNGG